MYERISEPCGVQTDFTAAGHVGAVKPARAHASWPSLQLGLTETTTVFYFFNIIPEAIQVEKN